MTAGECPETLDGKCGKTQMDRAIAFSLEWVRPEYPLNTARPLSIQ